MGLGAQLDYRRRELAHPVTDPLQYFLDRPDLLQLLIQRDEVLLGFLLGHLKFFDNGVS